MLDFIPISILTLDWACSKFSQTKNLHVNLDGDMHKKVGIAIKSYSNVIFANNVLSL